MLETIPGGEAGQGVAKEPALLHYSTVYKNEWPEVSTGEGSRSRQYKKFFYTLEEAREAKGLRESGERRPSSRRPFEDYALQWLDTYRGRTSRGLAESTRRTYRRDLERWAIPYLGNYKLDEIEPPDIRAFVAHLERKRLKPTTVRAILAPVKAMYATAVEDGAVRFNPTRNLRIANRREPDDREIRSLTRVELARLLAQVPSHWCLFFEFMAHTGLRISEAIGLTWTDLEFGDQLRLRVRQQDCRGEVRALKSEHSRRTIPLSPGLGQRLWELGADQPGTARVFTSATGKPINDGNLRRRVLLPATEAAGLGWRDADGRWRTWVTPHTFRHTCASLLFEAGRDVKQVSAWLGHADPSFTLRTYVHLMDEGVGDAAFLDEAVQVGNDWATRGPRTAANR